METTTLPEVEQRSLIDTDRGPELVGTVPVDLAPRKEGRILLAAGILLAAYSVVYLFVLAVKFQA